MKKKQQQTIDLDQEYTPNVATRAREAERQALAHWEAGAMAREFERRRMAAEKAQRAAQPIEDKEELSSAVADLAAAFGLKRRLS